MTEQQDVIAELGDAGVLDGGRWAYESACRRTLETYSEGDGHTAAWLGTTRFTLFVDRLDRVFTCGRYAIRSGDDHADEDVLRDQLSQLDIETMPRLDATLVRRSGLKGSPGWAFDSKRLLLASGVFGELDKIPWPRKSETKRRVARQPYPDSDQPSLFDALMSEEIGGLEALAATPANELDLDTYVVAHSLNSITGRRELLLGRPRLNAGGGPAWHWRQDLLTVPPSDGGRRRDDAPRPTGPAAVDDAPVRLRRPARRRDRPASGE